MADNPRYFTEEEEHRIVEAIREAEETSSVEIRVHVSKDPDENSLEETKKIFEKLRMYNTLARNGVLLHISFGSKSFAIFGDKGIDKVVPDNFWEETKELIQSHFQKGNFVDGICAGVLQVGEKLKEHFPLAPDDQNELSDEISYD